MTQTTEIGVADIEGVQNGDDPSPDGHIRIAKYYAARATRNIGTDNGHVAGFSTDAQLATAHAAIASAMLQQEVKRGVNPSFREI